MSKTKAVARNVATKKGVTIKKLPATKADSKAVKKTKAAVPSSQNSTASTDAKKKKSGKSAQDLKTAKVKKAPLVEPLVKPKKPITAYFAFLNARREQFKAQNPDLSITEIAKGMGQVWSKLTDAEKKPYVKFVEDDTARYQKEMKDLQTKGYFINKDGVNSKELEKEAQKKKALASGVQPKKVKSAYMFYNAETQAAIRAKNPDLKITEVSKLVAEQWNKLSEKDKKKWNDLKDQDQVRYDKELKQLQTKGYFVNSDGVKSTDIVQKKFKYPEGTVMPKKAKSAYQFYLVENQLKIMEKQKCTKDEAKQICEQVWDKLTDKQKTKYNKLHENDAKRYEKQIISVQLKGYFELEDGSKSQ